MWGSARLERQRRKVVVRPWSRAERLSPDGGAADQVAERAAAKAAAKALEVPSCCYCSIQISRATSWHSVALYFDHAEPAFVRCPRSPLWGLLDPRQVCRRALCLSMRFFGFEHIDRRRDFAVEEVGPKGRDNRRVSEDERTHLECRCYRHCHTLATMRALVIVESRCAPRIMQSSTSSRFFTYRPNRRKHVVGAVLWKREGGTKAHRRLRKASADMSAKAAG